MKHDDEKKLDAERFRAVVESYGANPERWPAQDNPEKSPTGDRQAYEKLVADAGEPPWLEDARRLDALLDEVPEIAPSPALLRRVAEIPARHATSPSGWIWPLGRLRTLVAMGAMAAAMGLVVGMTTTEGTATDDGGEEWDELSALALGTNVSEEALP